MSAERVDIPRSKLPQEFWDWLLKRLDLQDNDRPVISLMVDSDLKRELDEKLRAAPRCSICRDLAIWREDRPQGLKWCHYHAQRYGDRDTLVRFPHEV